MTGHTGHAMSMPMVPGWLRIVWVIALAAVALVHVWHARSVTGQARWWHTVHTLMALGMLAMYAADPMRQHALDAVEAAVFAVLTVALAATIAALSSREGVVNPLWFVTALDTLAMSYMSVAMLLPADSRPDVASWVFVVVLAGEGLAWATGLWGRVSSVRPTSIATEPVAAVVATSPDRGHAVPVGAAPTGERGVGLCAHCTIAVRSTLAVMAASMCYMLAVM